MLCRSGSSSACHQGPWEQRAPIKIHLRLKHLSLLHFCPPPFSATRGMGMRRLWLPHLGLSLLSAAKQAAVTAVEWRIRGTARTWACTPTAWSLTCHLPRILATAAQRELPSKVGWYPARVRHSRAQPKQSDLTAPGNSCGGNWGKTGSHPQH